MWSCKGTPCGIWSKIRSWAANGVLLSHESCSAQTCFQLSRLSTVTLQESAAQCFASNPDTFNSAGMLANTELAACTSNES